MRTRPPWAVAGWLCCFPRHVSRAPSTKAGRLDAFSVLCAMALSFRRAVSNYNSIISFDRRLQQKRTCSDILLQRALRSLLWLSSSLESFHFRVSDLVQGLGEPSSGTVSRHTVLFLELEPAVLPSLHGCAVCAQAQTTLDWLSAPHWFTMSCSHFTVYRISCILVCSHGMSSIHDAISWSAWEVFTQQLFSLLRDKPGEPAGGWAAV